MRLSTRWSVRWARSTTAPQTIVLDLSGLSFIDSTGLRLVLDLNDRYGGEADRLRVVAGSPAVERLLDIVGLRDQLPLVTELGR